MILCNLFKVDIVHFKHFTFLSQIHHQVKLYQPFLACDCITRKKLSNRQVCTYPSGKPTEEDVYINHENNTKFLKNSYKSTNKIYSTGDPDRFGTLCPELLLRKRLDNMPDEEGDEEVEEFVDVSEGKTRLAVLEYAKLIKRYLQQKKLLEALDVLDRMMKEKAKPDDYIFRLLISGCAKVGYTKKAFHLFNKMKKRSLKVKGGVYTSLFDACANSPWPSDGIKRAEGLWNLVIEKQVELNGQICHAAIKAFGRCGDSGRAFGIVDEMSSKGMPVTIETMNFLLQACASEKEAGFRHALMVWRKIIDKKLIPTIFTYNLLLRCTRDCSIGDFNTFKNDLLELFSPSDTLKICGEKKAYKNEKANLISAKSNLENLNLQNEEVLVPSQLLEQPYLNSEINLVKMNKPWNRLKLLGGVDGFINIMVKTGCTPDIKTFTQLLFVISPSIKEEQSLLSDMKRFRVKIDVDFCNMLIKKRNMNSNFVGAKDVLSLIKEEKLVPNIVTFGVLAMGCTNLKEMKILITDMKAMNLRLNIEILGTLLFSACRSWNFKAIHYLVEVLIKHDIKPNYIFHSHLDNLNQEIRKHIDKKKKGVGYCNKLESSGFKEEYEDFIQLISFIKSLQVDDQDRTHPWHQFQR